ncbi:heme-binding protein [Candidatus Methylobacter oryzae]|uniref:Heme-binding protein n=2 Tax=Candidatus Methylobacter oryzae TaxID=2497749 RepID=A0ABY3CCP8_9GAMM|nr:heme-binding protein [Candidatus Methylobacter oryzae]
MSTLGNRLIAIQKASTASAFSFDAFSISTANLYGLTLPGGSLYGLQFSNPITVTASNTSNLGSSDNTGSFGQGMSDPAVGTHVEGVIALGGGLALYNSQRVKVGAIGVSGDTSCTDHAIAWRLRTAMNLNNVPAGFGSGTGSSSPGALGDELVINTGNNVADITNTYKHPSCAITTAVTDPTAGAETGVIGGTGTGTTGTGTTGTGTTGTGTTGTGTTGTGTTGTGTTGTGTTGTGTTGTGTPSTGATGTGTPSTGTTG